MAEIEWTEEAKYWLQQIYDYIARDNEEAAWQVILGIYDRGQILRQFPETAMASRTCAISRSRPMKFVSGRGRLFREAPRPPATGVPAPGSRNAARMSLADWYRSPALF
jgi:plasmid stabilization system protein ParE